MAAENPWKRVVLYFQRQRDRNQIPLLALTSLLWIVFSYLDINIIVHYTGRVISDAPVETPLFIIYPICFSLMAGTVRWAFLWLNFKKDQFWFVLVLVMILNASVDWLVLLALSPGWEIPIREFSFTVALMTITGGMFGAATGIVLLDGILNVSRSRLQTEDSQTGRVGSLQV